MFTYNYNVRTQLCRWFGEAKWLITEIKMTYCHPKPSYLVDLWKKPRANPLAGEVIKSGQARKGTDEGPVRRGTHPVQRCQTGFCSSSSTSRVLQPIWPHREPSNGVAFAPLHCYWCTTNLVAYQSLVHIFDGPCQTYKGINRQIEEKNIVMFIFVCL